MRDTTKFSKACDLDFFFPPSALRLAAEEKKEKKEKKEKTHTQDNGTAPTQWTRGGKERKKFRFPHDRESCRRLFCVSRETLRSIGAFFSLAASSHLLLSTCGKSVRLLQRRKWTGGWSVLAASTHDQVGPRKKRRTKKRERERDND